VTVPDDVPGLLPTEMVLLTGPGGRYGRFFIDVARRQPPIPCVVEDSPTDDDVRAQWMTMPHVNRLLARVSWPKPPPGTCDLLYIEAMPAGSDGNELGHEWFPVAVRPPDSTSCVFSYRHQAYLRSSRPGGVEVSRCSGGAIDAEAVSGEGVDS
jgi:hypothetical protein